MTEVVYENEHDDEPLPAAGYRTYEVHQRERVGETTNLIKPRQLISNDFATDPYPLLAILREHYPCYRDWLSNRFWITRYDDVTSVFADEANYETRSKCWYYGKPGLGTDLLTEIPVLWARANRMDAAIDDVVDRALADLARQARDNGAVDLASGFAARLPLELWGAVLDLPADQLPRFASLYWRMQRGFRWHAPDQLAGLKAMHELAHLFEPLLAKRQVDPADDLISAAVALESVDGRKVTPMDVVVTVLEADHETLHGGLANLWFLLLTHPDQLEAVRSDSRLMKFAWLEALRHSTPVLAAERFARHEVERFGRLIPTGGLVLCSAAAANRDPRVFADPDQFLVERKDLCQREPRGQYRADGLPSGVAFGLGRPSVHPAVPKERPRSLYALTRDLAVHASQRLLGEFRGIERAPDHSPALRCLRLGEMHTCWELRAGFSMS